MSSLCDSACSETPIRRQGLAFSMSVSRGSATLSSPTRVSTFHTAFTTISTSHPIPSALRLLGQQEYQRERDTVLENASKGIATSTSVIENLTLTALAQKSYGDILSLYQSQYPPSSSSSSSISLAAGLSSSSLRAVDTASAAATRTTGATAERKPSPFLLRAALHAACHQCLVPTAVGLLDTMESLAHHDQVHREQAVSALSVEQLLVTNVSVQAIEDIPIAPVNREYLDQLSHSGLSINGAPSTSSSSSVAASLDSCERYDDDEDLSATITHVPRSSIYQSFSPSSRRNLHPSSSSFTSTTSSQQQSGPQLSSTPPTPTSSSFSSSPTSSSGVISSPQPLSLPPSLAWATRSDLLYSPDAMIFTQILAACRRVGDVASAIQVYRRMFQHTEGPGPNQRTHSIMLSILADHGLADRAVALYRTLHAQGVRLQAIATTAFINAVTKGRSPYYVEALQALDAMFEVPAAEARKRLEDAQLGGLFSSRTLEDQRISSQSMNVLTNSLLENVMSPLRPPSGRISLSASGSVILPNLAVIAISSHLETLLPSSITLETSTPSANARVSSRNASAVTVSYGQSQRRFQSSTSTANAFLIKTGIRLLRDVGMSHEALFLMRMLGDEVDEYALVSLMQACTNAGDYEGVASLMRTLLANPNNPVPDAVLAQALKSLCLQRGHSQLLWAMTMRCLTSRPLLNQIVIDQRTLSQLVIAFASDHDFDIATHILLLLYGVKSEFEWFGFRTPLSSLPKDWSAFRAHFAADLCVHASDVERKKMMKLQEQQQQQQPLGQKDNPTTLLYRFFTPSKIYDDAYNVRTQYDGTSSGLLVHSAAASATTTPTSAASSSSPSSFSSSSSSPPSPKYNASSSSAHKKKQLATATAATKGPKSVCNGFILDPSAINTSTRPLSSTWSTLLTIAVTSRQYESALLMGMTRMHTVDRSMVHYLEVVMMLHAANSLEALRSSPSSSTASTINSSSTSSLSPSSSSSSSAAVTRPDPLELASSLALKPQALALRLIETWLRIRGTSLPPRFCTGSFVDSLWDAQARGNMDSIFTALSSASLITEATAAVLRRSSSNGAIQPSLASQLASPSAMKTAHSPFDLVLYEGVPAPIPLPNKVKGQPPPRRPTGLLLNLRGLSLLPSLLFTRLALRRVRAFTRGSRPDNDPPETGGERKRSLECSLVVAVDNEIADGIVNVLRSLSIAHEVHGKGATLGSDQSDAVLILVTASSLDEWTESDRICITTEYTACSVTSHVSV